VQPNFRDEAEHDPGDRIIYIGDVRRRRGKVSRQEHRHYLYVLSACALFAWAFWLVVALNLSPAKLLTYLAFLSPLWLALAFTGTVTALVLAARYSEFVSVRSSARRGMIAASVVVGNLGLSAAHHWSLLAPLLLLAAGAGVELSFWYHDQQYR